MNKIERRTELLFPKRNFWTGFSGILNIFRDKYQFNTSKSGEEIDKIALQSDWEMIGGDIKNAFSKLAQEL